MPSSEHYENNDLFIIFNSTSEKKDGGKQNYFEAAEWIFLNVWKKYSWVKLRKHKTSLYKTQHGGDEGAAKFIFEAILPILQKKKRMVHFETRKDTRNVKKTSTRSGFAIQKQTKILIHKATKTRRHGRKYYGFFQWQHTHKRTGRSWDRISVGGGRLFRTRPDRLWGPPSLL